MTSKQNDPSTIVTLSPNAREPDPRHEFIIKAQELSGGVLTFQRAPTQASGIAAYGECYRINVTPSDGTKLGAAQVICALVPYLIRAGLSTGVCQITSEDKVWISGETLDKIIASANLPIASTAGQCVSANPKGRPK